MFDFLGRLQDIIEWFIGLISMGFKFIAKLGDFFTFLSNAQEIHNNMLALYPNFLGGFVAILYAFALIALVIKLVPFVG